MLKINLVASDNDDKDQDSYFNKDHYPETALGRGSDQFFESRVYLYHLVVGFVHIRAKFSQHFVLGCDFLVEVLTFIFYV